MTETPPDPDTEVEDPDPSPVLRELLEVWSDEDLDR
jgi:hypothetical protein